jgi:hypothetical protein
LAGHEAAARRGGSTLSPWVAEPSTHFSDFQRILVTETVPCAIGREEAARWRTAIRWPGGRATLARLFFTRSPQMLLSTFRRLWNPRTTRTRARKPERRQQFRPTLETLEDRLVPTVVFRPQFGVEKMEHGNGAHLNSPTVNFIFWGGGWGAGNNWVQQALPLTSAANNIFTSDYLSRLNQYGSDGHAILGKATWDNSDPVSTQFDDGTINDRVKFQVNANTLPGDKNAIYVVVTPPGVISNDPNAGGFNHNDDYPEIWVSTRFLKGSNTVIDTDGFTATLSHEMAECMSSLGGGGFEVYPGKDFHIGAALTSNWGQIGDYEGNSYRFREPNGVQVQPYWSKDDQGWITPDGNSQNLYLDPIWAINGFIGQYFTKTYDLTIDWAHLVPPANSPNVITISTGSNGGVEVNLNGWQTTFDRNQIHSISVNAGGWNAVINVEGSAGVPVNINLGTGSDTVNITPTSRNLNNLLGSSTVPAVVVTGGIGSSTLNINDQANNAGNLYLLDAGSVESANGGNINTISYSGISNVLLNCGSGADYFTVYNTSPGCTTFINCGTGGTTGYVSATTGTLDLGTGSSNDVFTLAAQGLGGSVYIQGTAPATLNVKDASDTATRTLAISAYSVSGLTPVPITFGGPGLASPLGALHVDTGPGTNTINVLSAPAPFTVHGDGNSPSGWALNYQIGTLNLDDGHNPAVTTYTVTAASLQRAAANRPLLTVNYGQFKGLPDLELDTGSSTDVVNVESTSCGTAVLAGGGTDTFNVAPTSQNLSSIAGTLSIAGGATGHLIINDQASSYAAKGWSTSYTVTNGSLTRTLLFSGGKSPTPPKYATIYYTQLADLTLNASNVRNSVDVESTPALTKVEEGAAKSTVSLCALAQNLDGIDNLEIDGGQGGVTLTAYDQANPWGNLSGVSSRYMLGDGLTRKVTHGQRQSPVTTGMEFFGLVSITLYTSTSSPNVVAISDPGYGIAPGPVPTTIDSGAADKITVSGDAGQVTVDAHGGSLDVDNHLLQNESGGADNTTQVFTVGYTISDQAVVRSQHDHSETWQDNSDKPGGKGTTFSGSDSYSTETITYANVASLRIDAGAVDTSFLVSSTAAKTPVTINASSGARPGTFKPAHAPGTTTNQFQVGSGTVQAIRSSVTLNGTAASPQSSSLLVDDSQFTQLDEVSVGAGRVGAGALDLFFRNGGQLSYSGMGALTLKLSNASDDTAAVTPDPVTTFTVNGSQAAFQAGHGALLSFNQLGQVKPVNNAATPPTPGSGYWTFGTSNLKQVNYTNMAAPLTNVTSALKITTSGAPKYDPSTGYWKQTVTLTNSSGQAIVGPLSLVLDNLSSNATVVKPTGTTLTQAPAFSPYLDTVPPNHVLANGQSVQVTLYFQLTSIGSITYTPRVLAGSGQL